MSGESRIPYMTVDTSCNDKHPLIGGGACNGDHRENLHHNDAGFFWGPIEEDEPSGAE